MSKGFPDDMSLRVHPRLTWFTPCWAALVRVKAAESQRPKGTPMQAETIYCFSAGAGLRQRPAAGEAAGAVVHRAAVQGRRRHGRRRRRSRRSRQRPRSRQAVDEDLDGDVVGGDKFASEPPTNLHLKSRAIATSNLRKPSWLRVAVKDALW